MLNYPRVIIKMVELTSKIGDLASKYVDLTSTIGALTSKHGDLYETGWSI